jgi:hypothetical protein
MRKEQLDNLTKGTKPTLHYSAGRQRSALQWLAITDGVSPFCVANGIDIR